MAGRSIKNKRNYKALKRKGMPKSRAAAISNAGKQGLKNTDCRRPDQSSEGHCPAPSKRDRSKS